MDDQEAFERVNVERTLGHDLCAWSRGLPINCPAGIVEGYLEAQGQGISRQRPDRFVRKWLQLRLHALERQRVVNDDVTPDLLRRLDVSHCPITRAELTHGELLDTDWSVDRLNNDGAYASNNLAVMSTRANRSKGARSFQEVYALSQKDHPSDALTPVEWLRAASIMLGPCDVDNPGAAPVIPLAAPMPSYSLRQAVQQVQFVFTLRARKQSGKNAVIKMFTPAARTERSAARLQMAAEAMHQGLKDTVEPYDVWLNPSVLQSFGEWWHTLDRASRALAGELSRRLLHAEVVPGGRLLEWNVRSRGHFP